VIGPRTLARTETQPTDGLDVDSSCVEAKSQGPLPCMSSQSKSDLSASRDRAAMLSAPSEQDGGAWQGLSRSHTPLQDRVFSIIGNDCERRQVVAAGGSASLRGVLEPSTFTEAIR
jgi:hypothetical protein